MTSTISDGEENPTPGWMSRTSRVPAGVPSVRQSSCPIRSIRPVSQPKYRYPPDGTNSVGLRMVDPCPVAYSRRIEVPPGVPSEVQSSKPLSCQAARK